jgi:hypothetical protein
METYNLVLNTKEFLGAMSDYISLKNNKPIKVKESHSIGYFGYHEERQAEIKIYYEETIDILGHQAVKTVELSKEDLKQILDDLLKEKGYYVQKISYQSGIHTTGYYRDEHEEAYFSGVELQLGILKKELKKK